MKKIINLILVFICCFCFLFSNLDSSFANSAVQFYVKSGVAISDIDLSTFMAKHKAIPVSIDFVDDIESLNEVPYISNKNNVSLFAKLDLFCYSYESKAPSTKEDLLKYFNSLDKENFTEREQLFSVLSSLYEENGIPKTISKKSEPAVEITYRYESTKNGYVAIPERHIVKKDTYTTDSYVDPLKFTYKDVSSYYNFLDSFFIQPSYFLVKTASSKYRNSNIDFDGFYIPLPYEIDDNYSKIAKKTLAKLENDLSKNNKKIAFSNVNLSNVNAVKDFGEVFVVPVADESLDSIGKIRDVLGNKTIVASFDGELSNISVKKFLQSCVFSKAIPLFRRDISSGEFMYYENSFEDYVDTINYYLEFLNAETNLDFIKSENYSNFSTNLFAKGNTKLFVFNGSGHINYKIAISEIPSSDFSYHSKGLKDLKIVKNDNLLELDFDLDGIGSIEFNKDSVYILATAKKPSSKNSVAVFIKNGSNEETECNLTLNSRGAISNISLDFNPFEEKSYVLDQGESLTLNGEAISNPFGSKFNLLNLIIILLFTGLSFFFSRKEFMFKSHLSKNFLYVLMFVTTLLLLYLNVKVVGYCLTTFLFFLVAVYFAVFSLHAGNTKPIGYSFLCILLGLIYNLFEVGTFLPRVAAGFTSQLSFEVVLFYMPLTLMIAILLIFGRKINILELVFVFALLLFTLFFKMTLMGFYERSAFYAYIPFWIVLVFEFLLLFQRKLFSPKNTILFILSIALTLCFPIINNFVLSKSLTNSSFYLLSYSFILFFLLTFLLLIEIAETKNEVKNSILNPVCISFVLIYGGIAFLTQGGYLGLGSQIFLNLGFILQFVPIILFLTMFLDLFKPNES